MKRVSLFLFVVAVVILAIPLFIVKSCSREEVRSPSEKKAEMKIKAYLDEEKKVVEMPFEEYIKGVVAAEMPASFEMEALKAQAVAARTYAYGRMIKLYAPKDDIHHGADICTSPGHCQAWIAKDAAMKKWGVFNGTKNWTKISTAVNNTKNLIIVYENSVVNPVFHSNSGGRTENSEDVWTGGQVAYLRSVESRGEEDNPEYENTVILQIKDFCGTLKAQYPNIKLNEKDVLKDVNILDNTEGGRVKDIKIGNITLKGTDFRRIFSLKSSNFTLEKQDKNSLKITTYGNGHGVGMSQWGANSLAKDGDSFEKILKYYYQGVGIETIDDLKASGK